MCVCVSVVRESRKLCADECPLRLCLSWVARCDPASVRGLDQHQFILVENDASGVDVRQSLTHSHAIISLSMSNCASPVDLCEPPY